MLRFLPFTLSVNLVFAEGHVLELELAASVDGPTTDVIVRCPPEEIRNEQSRGGGFIGRAIVIFLALDTLLRRRGVLVRGLVLRHVVVSIRGRNGLGLRLCL